MSTPIDRPDLAVPPPDLDDDGDLPRVEVTSASPLLVDRFMPHFDATERVHLVVDADLSTTWEALTDLDLARVHSPLMDAAMAARDLPRRVAVALGRTSRPEPPPVELPLVGGVELDGWMALGREPGSEVAIGAVGRFWTPTIQWYDVEGMTTAEFADFDEPGWGRIVASFSLRPYGEARTLVSYEARTHTTDDDSATRFRRYWSLVRPFVGHIMRATLETLREDAEAGRPTPS